MSQRTSLPMRYADRSLLSHLHSQRCLSCTMLTYLPSAELVLLTDQ